jgi:hypothetical protein
VTPRGREESRLPEVGSRSICQEELKGQPVEATCQHLVSTTLYGIFQGLEALPYTELVVLEGSEWL